MKGATKEIFIQYFADGMTPATAKTIHELKLIEQHGDDITDIASTLANAHINPTQRQVYHLYDKWRYIFLHYSLHSFCC
jgi:hypothetical protein